MLISIFYLISLFLIKNKTEKDEYDKHLKKMLDEMSNLNEGGKKNKEYEKIKKKYERE